MAVKCEISFCFPLGQMGANSLARVLPCGCYILVTPWEKVVPWNGEMLLAVVQGGGQRSSSPLSLQLSETTAESHLMEKELEELKSHSRRRK